MPTRFRAYVKFDSLRGGNRLRGETTIFRLSRSVSRNLRGLVRSYMPELDKRCRPHWNRLTFVQVPKSGDHYRPHVALGRAIGSSDCYFLPPPETQMFVLQTGETVDRSPLRKSPFPLWRDTVQRMARTRP